MKVAVLGPIFPFEGGIVQHTSNISKALKEDHQVDVFSWYSQYPKKLYKHHPELKKDEQYALSWCNGLSWLKMAQKLKTYDKVIIPWTSPFHVAPFSLFALILKDKLVVHVHNLFPHEKMPLQRLLTKQFFKLVFNVVCHADSIKEGLREIGYSKKINVIPHPPNIEVAYCKKVKKEINILTFGYIRDYKGVDIALKSFGELISQNENIKLTVAGKIWNEDPREYDEIIDYYFMRDKVTTKFHYISDEETSDLFQEADILLAPYRSASQSGVIPLAFAAGVVPVVTNVGGLKETITHLKNGVLAEEVTVNSVKKALILAIENLEGLKEESYQSKTVWKDVVGIYVGNES